MNLLPFQIESIDRQLQFLNSNGSVYNASEQGLGKTVTTIKVIEKLNVGKTLIICPAVMRLTWEAEMRKWFADAPPINVLLNGRSKWDPESCITIISYNLCEKFLEDINNEEWKFLVMDEAHYLKSHTAKRTKTILGVIWKRARYKIALSGTPITNSVVDGFTLFNRMSPKDFPTFHGFVGEYSYMRRTPWAVQYYGIRNEDKLRNLIRERFFIRYTKQEVLPELPDKIYQEIILPETLAVKVPKGEQEKLREQIKALVAAIKDSAPIPVQPMMLATQKRLQGEAKVGAVAEFVKNLLDEGTPVVLFAYHTNVIKKLVEELSEYNPQVITGETTGEERFRCVQAFQQGESDLFIGQMVAAGVGITLTRSSNVVLAEMDWSPAVIAQAVDRTHRIGQKDTVNVYYFIVKGSIDESLVRTVMSKVRIFNKVIENG